MVTTLIRAFILYLLIMVAVRLMGKRQLGEMQPTELVTTIMLSELATIPMQDNEIPLINSIIAVMLLVAMSIITSVITLRCLKVREAFEGHPAILINDGKIDQKKMAELRITIQDLMGALRQKDVFDIEQVQYAIIETNGSVSVMLKPEYTPLTQSPPNPNASLQHLIICDGKILKKAFGEAELTQKQLNTHLKKINLKVKDIMLLTHGKDGFGKAVKKE